MSQQHLFTRFPTDIAQRTYSSTQAIQTFQVPMATKTKKLFSPTVQLSGSHASLLTCKVSPDGQMLVTGGFDKQVYLWDIYDECKNFAVLKGHTNAILEAQWSTDSSLIFTAAADKTLAVWDVETLKRIKKCNHQSFVNSCYPVRRGPEYICTAVDDGNNIVWDLRAKNFVMNFQNKYASTTITFNDTADKLFSAGIDNQIKVFDLRKREIDTDSTLLGHTDTITGIALSHDGSYLLSNSMDLTIRCWDVRPFVTGKRCVKIFQGASHNFEKNLLRVAWSADGNYISSGSSDKLIKKIYFKQERRFTYIWDTTTRKIIARLPGHNGSVNETSFSPTDNLIASASSDQTAIVGEYEPNI